MFVFIPGSIPSMRFEPGGTDPAEISIPAVTYIGEENAVFDEMVNCEVCCFYLVFVGWSPIRQQGWTQGFKQGDGEKYKNIHPLYPLV